MTPVDASLVETPIADEFANLPYDLESCEPPLESDLHLYQIFLLLECLKWAWRDRTDFYTAGNLTIYFSPQHRKSEDFRGPDFFVVLGVDPKPRKSWVLWQEGGRYPNVIVELLSPSTAAVDRGAKKALYQDVFRTPDYFWFDPLGGEELAGFHLLDGHYEAIAPNPQGWLWSEQLQLYLGKYEQTLRFFTPDGEMIPTPAEAAEVAIASVEIAQEQARTAQAQARFAQAQAQSAQEQARSAQEEAQAIQAQLQAEQEQRQKLAAKLQELGIDPTTL